MSIIQSDTPNQSSSSKRKAEQKKQSLEEAVRFFTTGSNTKQRGNVALQLSLDTIEAVAFETGLNGDHIVQLLNVAASGKFAESTSLRLVKALVPAAGVPEEAVLSAVSWMCTNTPSTNFQCLLVRWLLVTYDLLDSTEGLHSLYSFLFYFLENDAMCPFVCHLLYLLTRKEDVKYFRVRALLQLQQKMGVQPHIMGLLSLYKLYCPHLVAIVIPRNRKVFFKRTDKAWSAKVKRVQDARRPPEESVPPTLTQTNTATRETSQPPLKKQKAELIPSAEASCALSQSAPSKVSTGKTTVPFAQIRNFSQLIKNLDRLELPGQMAAVLKDRNLQHVLLCHQDPVIPFRIQYWLDHVLYQEFLENPDASSPRAQELLQLLIQLADFLQEGVPICEHFLANYLHVWNGADFRPFILKLLTRLRLQDYAELNDVILEPLRNFFFSSSVYFKCQLVMTFTELLHNYVSVELSRHQHTLDWQQQQELTPSNATNSHSVFPEKVDKVSVLTTLVEYVGFVDAISVLGLRMEDNHALLMHCVLSFYEEVCSLHLDHGVPFICSPSRGIVYSCLFSNNAVAISRMCRLICRYRQSFESLREVDSSTLSTEEKELRAQSIAQIGLQNSIILDYVDTLWRYRAFISKESHTIYQLLDPSDLDLVKGSHRRNQMFSIHQHQALIGHAHDFLAKTQPEDSKIHPVAIKKARDVYLEYLRQEHVTGVPDIISTLVKRRTSGTPQTQTSA